MRIFLFLVIAVFLPGCDFFDNSVEVELALPGLPGSWENRWGNLPFIIRYYDPGYGIREKKTAPGQRFSTIRLSRITNNPVTAVPLLEKGNGGVFLKSAGCFFPHDIGNSGVMRLEWEKGFAAEILMDLNREAWLSLESLNLERFLCEIKKKSKGDPWSLNRRRIVEYLLKNKFRADRIKKMATHSLTINADEGIWFSDNPFFPSSESGAAKRLKIDGIYPGKHVFFLSGGSQLINLYITERNWYAVNPSTGSSESGTW